MGIHFFHISLLHIYNIDSAACKSHSKSKSVIFGKIYQKWSIFYKGVIIKGVKSSILDRKFYFHSQK